MLNRKLLLQLAAMLFCAGFTMALSAGRAAAAPGDITTVVGGGASDGIPATTAHLAGPDGVGVNSAGDIAIADYRGSRIYKVDGSTGIISHVVGTGENSRTVGWSG